MIDLESITPGLSLTGLEASVIGTVVAVVPIADGTIQVIYKTPDGTLKDRLLNRGDEANIAVATAERPWSFEGDSEAFKLTVEAKRIDLAFLFDPMMAVHTSNVDPLPHQITAVYESMLPRQPLRFVLADDPGAGKTIMAGLYIRELIMRADARRILIVAPGSLVEQWREELFEKFGLEFRIFTKDLEAATPSGNPFEDLDHLIVRLDQMARNEDLQEKLCNAGWDLVVFDEAHKLAAHFYGTKLEKTGRFKLAERLGAQTRHLLLMTATPHNGKEEDFQLFLSLLDSDRFYGKFRDGVHKVDCSDLIRRMVKEKLVKFDGTPLFPERRAYTLNYQLSDLEAALYEAVSVLNLIEDHPALLLSETHGGRSFNFVAAPIVANSGNSSEWGFFDLQFDPTDYVDAPDDALKAALVGNRKAIRKVAANSQPGLLPLEFCPEDVRGGRLSVEVYQERSRAVREHSTFRGRVASLLARQYADQPRPENVEQRIYERFPSRVDERLMSEFHAAKWPARAQIVEDIEDQRYRQFGRRMLATERLSLLSPERQRQYADWRRERLLASGEAPWRTLSDAREEAQQLSESASEGQRLQLMNIEEHLRRIEASLSA